MKSLLTIVKGNVRKNKGSYIGIMILMFVVSLSFVSIYSVSKSTEQRKTECIEETGFGDYWACLISDLELSVDGNTAEKIIKKIESCDVVGKLTYTKAYGINVKITDEIVQWSIFVDYDNEMVNYIQYDENNKRIDNPKLGEKEVSLPICFRNSYGYHIGDTILLVIGKDEYLEFTVASFFEDPMMGSSTMGIKTLLIGKDSHTVLDEVIEKELENREGKYHVLTYSVLNIFKKDSTMKDSEFEKRLNQDNGFVGYAMLTLSKGQSDEYTMVLPNLFAGIATVFIIVLLISAFVVMGHSINSSIEQDFTNMGIYKAVGMTSMMIRVSLAISYTFASLIGLLLGLPVSVPIINIMNGFMRDSSGLYAKTSIGVGMGLAMMAVTVAVITFFVVIKSKKIAKITPVAALNQGIGMGVNVKKTKTKINPKMLNISLALRQFVSGFRKYISVAIVTVMLTVLMVIMNNVFVWTSRDDLIADFMLYDFDALIAYDAESEAEIKQIIGEYSDFDLISEGGEYVLFDDTQLQCTFLSHPEYIKGIEKGKPCVNDNEIMISPYVSKAYNLKIGDTVKVSILGESKEMVISGICNLSNDMGKAFLMSEAARATFKVGKYSDNFEDVIGTSEDKYYAYSLKLTDSSKITEISKALHSCYGTELTLETGLVQFELSEDVLKENNALGDIGTTLQGMTFFIYILGAIFICVTTTLVANKIMLSEKRDYGIYKSIGMHSSKLRKQVSIKFVIVAIIGTLIGDVLGVLLLKPILTPIFAQFGITNYAAKVNTSDVLIPLVFMTIVAYLCAYMSSRKIKKVDPRMLIVE